MDHRWSQQTLETPVPLGALQSGRKALAVPVSSTARGAAISNKKANPKRVCSVCSILFWVNYSSKILKVISFSWGVNCQCPRSSSRQAALPPPLEEVPVPRPCHRARCRTFRLGTTGRHPGKANDVFVL